MADSPTHPDSTTGADGPRDRPPTPRWVKVSGFIALVLVLVVLAVLLIGSGNHGPGRHVSSGGAGSQSAPAESVEPGSGGHTPPAGGHNP